MTKRKPLPKFSNEASERRFWRTHDSTEYLDWSKAQRARFPNLKPSTQAISLRLPQHMLERIKTAANRRDVPYQSLIKIWLEEKLKA
jgi:predicted DNA binding CopG/RHH family protein